jgi:hypothetical protein
VSLDFPNTPANGQSYTGSAGNTWIWDGVKWESSADAGGPWLPIAGGTMGGALTLAGDPTTSMMAATKNYVDTQAGVGKFLPLNPSPVTATGSTTSRSLQDRLAESLNLRDYIQSGDTDATAGFGRVLARAAALGTPVEVYVPAGTYNISAAIAVVVAASQGVSIRGAGAAWTTIVQTADADGFDVSLTNYSRQMSNSAFRFQGITLRMAATASTAHTALSIATTAGTGTQGVPLVVDDVIFVSASATAFWAIGLAVTQLPNIAYLSRISSSYIGAPAGSTHIAISGNATSFSTSIFLRDATLIGGSVGVNLGNYLQGVTCNNLNTLNMPTALRYLATAGNNVEIRVADSYLLGAIVMSATAPGVLNSVKFTACYFDSISNVLPNNSSHVSFTNVPVLQVTGCTFNGPVSAQSNITGLSIAGASGTTYETLITNNVFQAYGNGGVGAAIGSGVNQAAFHGNTFLNNSTDVTDAGTGTVFTATQVEGVFYAVGTVANTTASRWRGGVTQYGNFSSYDTTGTNSVTLFGSATGQGVTIGAVGSDANIPLSINAKGTGQLYFGAPANTMGLMLGSVGAASVTDLSKHISLYGGVMGFNVTTGRQNYVVASGNSHFFNVNAVDIASISSAGVAIGALVDPLNLTSPAGVTCRIGYLITGHRQWAVGPEPDYTFRVTDIGGSVDVLVMNAGSGNVNAFGSLGIGGTTGPTWSTGSAVPNATAPVGSLYSRVGGALGATLYVSRGGGTWAAVAGV